GPGRIARPFQAPSLTAGVLRKMTTPRESSGSVEKFLRHIQSASTGPTIPTTIAQTARDMKPSSIGLKRNLDASGGAIWFRSGTSWKTLPESEHYGLATAVRAPRQFRQAESVPQIVQDRLTARRLDLDEMNHDVSDAV